MLNDMQTDFVNAVTQACGKAAELLALEDVDSSDEEEYDTIYNDRNHCEVCQVRTVMETVWPSMKAYINWLEGQLGLELTGGSEG